MRIAITNWSNRAEGGVEHYLSSMGAIFLERGHEVALLHEYDAPSGRPRVPIASRIPTWDIGSLGLDRALSELRAWGPDIIYGQGMLDPNIEDHTLEVAPGVAFLHNYNGTCISGSRLLTFPHAKPCDKKFGPGCLFHFYTRRCGGLNPLTMIHDYKSSSERLKLLSKYSAVVTHTRHIQRLFQKNGIACEVVRFAPVEPGDRTAADAHEWTRPPAWRLLMMGRMTPVKGGRLFIDALPQIAQELSSRLVVTVAGDGPDRHEWEIAAARVHRDHPEIEIRFPGWLSGEERQMVASSTDLLALPSVWPEPFGMVGFEVGRHGIPTVAFASGGIPQWLIDGVNGCLAPGDKPTPSGFASAVVRALSDEASYLGLRQGARQASTKVDECHQYDDLMKVFSKVTAGRTKNAAERQWRPMPGPLPIE